MTSQKAYRAKAQVISDFISFSAINGGAIHEKSHNFPTNSLGFSPSVHLVFFNWSFILKVIQYLLK